MSNQHLLIKLLISLCVLLSFCSSGATYSLQNPYKVIYDRNLFALRPPIPVQKPQTPSAPPPNLILTGITTVLGQKRAFLEITVPAKPPQPVKQQSIILSEGQQEENVRVIEIDPKAETVKVSNSGIETVLTFDKNGRKPTPGPTTSPVINRTLPVRRIPTLSFRR